MWIWAHECRFHQRPGVSTLGAGTAAVARHLIRVLETELKSSGEGASPPFLKAGSLTRTRVCRLNSVDRAPGIPVSVHSVMGLWVHATSPVLFLPLFFLLGVGGGICWACKHRSSCLCGRHFPHFSQPPCQSWGSTDWQIASVRILVSFLSNHNTKIGGVCMPNKEKLHVYLLGSTSLFLPIKRNQRNKNALLSQKP